MKKGIVFFLFILCCFPLLAQWNTTNILRKGQSAIYYDDYVSAIDNFNQIIRVRPHLSEPYFFRGLAKLNLDDYDGAVSDFSRALELDPNYFHAFAYRGMALHRLKRYDEAIRDYNSAIAINPKEAYVFANRAITEADMGNAEAAERDYSKALIIDNKLTAAYLNRAILRERQGNMEGAITDCNVAIKLNSFSDEAYGLRGYLRYLQKDYRNAIDDYNRALNANPENERVLMSRAITWYEMRKYPEALADYSRVIELDSSATYAFYNRGLLRAEIGEYNNAIDDLSEVLKMNRDNILIYFNRGLLKMEIKDLEGAYDDFTESIALYPDFVKAYLARSGVSADMGDYTSADKDRYKAHEIMDRYKRMQAGDRNALVDTTESFRRLVDINSRNDRIREVINGRVQDKDVIIELQDIFVVQYLDIDTLRKGRVQYFNKHIMAFNQSRNYMPALTLTNKTFIFPDGFLAEQIVALGKRTAKDRSDVDAFLLRGGFYLELNDFSKAIDDFKAILDRDPNHLFARFNLANARMKMYDYVESIEEKNVRIVGEEQVKRSVDYSLILEDYERCLKLDPDFVFATYNIANVYAKSGRIDEAIALYDQVLEKDKDIAEAYYNRGLLHVFQGNKQRANTDLSKAGELGLTDAYSIIKRYCSD